MKNAIIRVRTIWKELDDFRVLRPYASFMDFFDHLIARKGDSILDYNLLYPYIIIVFYLKANLEKRIHHE